MIAGRVTEHLDKCSLTDTARDEAQRSYVRALDVGLHWASALIEKTARRLSILARRGEGWAVGWRALALGQPLALSTDAASYRLIGDDRRRYFADPFLFTYSGKTHLFVEEFDYASERGVISVFTRTAEGSFGDRRIVLTQPYHLSYPMIFLDGGQIWMIPECGETGRVEIYRAAEYPNQWIREAVLIENGKAFDATLHRDRRVIGYLLPRRSGAARPGIISRFITRLVSSVRGSPAVLARPYSTRERPGVLGCCSRTTVT
jgi:hypothetical protein